jgi:hypothetical protein
MIHLRDLTVKNFMSVGNTTQAIDFDRSDLTLVLGENLDMGGDGSRNGTGKCCCINTIIKVRNIVTGEISELTVGELYHGIKSEQTRDSE